MSVAGQRGDLRFGVMVPGMTLKKWQVECIEHLLGHDKIRLSLLIVDKGDPYKRKGLREKAGMVFSKNGLYHIYQRYWQKPDALENISIESLAENVDSFECQAIRKGRYSDYFVEEDIARIRSYKLDFILRFGFNILRGEVLDAARYGIWSFHHGDEQEFRGGPPGFWEIYSNTPVNGVILQRITEKLDSGYVLKKGFLKTQKHSYCFHLNEILSQFTDWPLAVCKDILNDNSSCFEQAPSSSNAPVTRLPNNRQMIFFLIRILLNKLKFQFDELFRHELWSVGVAHQPAGEIVETGTLRNVSWFPADKSAIFRADPCGFLSKDDVKLIYEYYDYSVKKGILKSCLYRGEVFSEEEKFLEMDYHIAYPYTFTHEGEVYMTLESALGNRVDLYQLKKKDNFVFVKTLLENVDAVDPTIFYYQGNWWIFCTRKSFDSNTRLFAYYSDTLTGPYVPHSNNPVKVDVRSSRPGGRPFVSDNKFIRPAQDNSEIYGGALVLNEIITLNSERFEEKPLRRIEPVKPYPHGIHTVSGIGNLTVIDGKRLVFIPEMFYYQLKRKFKKLLGK